MSLPVAKIHSELRAHRREPLWLVAYSGGLDSTVLLHLIKTFGELNKIPCLRALHVNHRISDNADGWQRHCAAVCEAWGVDFVARRVRLTDTGHGLEASARQARYEVFARQLLGGGLLLQGHHLDDQIETFFLRLMRGAGLSGLAGIPGQRSLGEGYLLRPLLDCTRQDLRQYAEDHGLNWVEDDGNADVDLDRNYLRHQVLPLLQARWPAYRRRVQSAMSSVAEAESLLLKIDQGQLEQAMGIHFGEQTLSWNRSQTPDEARQSRYIRAWLLVQGCAMPDKNSLQEFIRQLNEGHIDSQPQMKTRPYSVRFFQNRLYLSPARVDELLSPRLQAVTGRGVSAARAGELYIAFRSGGERCQPMGRSRSRSLKKLLQDYGVPPWRRDQLPLLVNGSGDLVAVADLWICEGFQAEQDEEGFELVWRGGKFE